MHNDVHLKKEHYKHLAEVFLMVSKIFSSLKDGRALKSNLACMWPKDKVFKGGLCRKVTGFDLFSWHKCRKTRIGENPLEQYTKINEAWVGLSKSLRDKYELMARKYSLKIQQQACGDEK